MTCKKFITIGRHPYTLRQKELLMKVGLKDEVERITQVNNPTEVVNLAKEYGAQAIVVQALPLSLLAQLLQVAKQSGIEVYQFEMETFATVKANESCPADAEVERPAEGGYKRCIRTKRLVKIKRITIETEPVAE